MTDFSKTWIIAEAGVNHNGSLDAALQLVDAAVDAKADCVKFQTFRAEALVTKDAQTAAYQKRNTGSEVSQYEMLQALELSHDDHRLLLDHCRKSGIDFLSTPFDRGSFDYLRQELGLNRIKLGSSELTNAPLLVQAGASGAHIILSTGMGSVADVDMALGALALGVYGSSAKAGPAAFRDAFDSAMSDGILKDRVSVLQCSTAYPMPASDANLAVIPAFRERYGLTIGYSDHSLGIVLAPAAVALGAGIIEKHITLDKSLPGPDHKASLAPGEFIDLVRAIREVEAAVGDPEKRPQPSEIENMPIARKSLAAACEVRQGEIWTEDMLTSLRPGTGLSPVLLWDVVGQPAVRDFKAGELIEMGKDSVSS